MTQVPLKLENSKWIEVEESNFKLDRYLLEKLQRIEKIISKNFDALIIFDGMERAGKSTLAMMCAWYLSKEKLTLNNFARGLQDAAKKIAELPDRSVLIMDEASLVFSAKDSMASSQKQLLKILDVVGQKNMVFILCLPCFFDLNKTIAVRRSKFLVHVKPDKEYNRGEILYWGERKKKILYKHGKQNYDSYAFPRHDWVGRYVPFWPPFFKEYEDTIKKDSLREVLGGEGGNENDKKFFWRTRLLEVVSNLKEKQSLTYKELSELTGLSANVIRSLRDKYKGEVSLAPPLTAEPI